MKEIHNLGHSVHDRLLNLAHRDQQPYDLVLVRYALERLLYRLSCSEYHSRFVLKGAFLFVAWREAALRPTRDMDLLGYGSPDVPTVARVSSPGGAGCGPGIAISSHLDAGQTVAPPPALAQKRLTTLRYS